MALTYCAAEAFRADVRDGLGPKAWKRMKRGVKDEGRDCREFIGNRQATMLYHWLLSKAEERMAERRWKEILRKVEEEEEER